MKMKMKPAHFIVLLCDAVFLVNSTVWYARLRSSKITASTDDIVVSRKIVSQTHFIFMMTPLTKKCFIARLAQEQIDVTAFVPSFSREHHDHLGFVNI